MSTVVFSIENGFLKVSVLCVSSHSLLWTTLLLVDVVLLSVLLVIFAILTRKVKYRHFKDTKKVAMLSFTVVFTAASGLCYWYLLRIIQADTVLVNAVLQISYYLVIIECQGFVFAPKLFPISKGRVRNWYYKVLNVPVPKSVVRVESQFSKA